MTGEVSEVPLPARARHITQSPWRHACAVLTDGSAWCWGEGSDGQLGDGLATSSEVPVRVLDISTATMISAGTEHTCALLADGEVRCWGVNFTGRLGTGSSDHSVVPLPVIGLHDAVWIAAGAGHTCAVDAARGLWCWGRNNHGQIGVGDDRDRLSPARVEVLERAMEVAAGMFHTCAIRFDGVPYCWGQNRFGQLGIGSDLGSSAVPLRVPGVTSAVSVDAGWTHACSLSSAGLVSCWGGDFGGEPLVLCGEDLGVEVCACDNGEDDDRDGLVDCFDEECADSDCSSSPEC